MRCSTNEATPVVVFSDPFTMTVTKDCSTYISAVTPLATSSFTKNVPNTPPPLPGAYPVILYDDDYALSTDLVNCPLSFTLWTVSPDAAYTGS